jgi:acyl-CoA reductase-like NAD-dependent aldehyde dehydrogenase
VLAPALAAGNTIVCKPPELAPYTSLAMGDLFLEAGIPPGVVNIVAGGPAGGEALVRHPGVDKIHFTGSGATARKIINAASDNLTPLGLELGGKSGIVVFDDADVGGAVQHGLGSVVSLSGQGCVLGTRLIVQAGIYDDLVEQAAASIGFIQPGDPFDESTFMGPVINEAAADRILGVIDRARNESRLVTGGNRMGGDLANGYFIEPTIFADVDNSSDLGQNEVFGPVLAITRFESEEEGVAIANDSLYGLGAYVHTNDLRRAHRVAAQLEAGTVFVNGFIGLPANIPFGGNKQSGYGRIGGRAGLHEFLRPKNVWIQM